MKTLLIVCLALFSSCLINTLALAISERCSEIEQKSGLNLNEAECYVLERLEKGELAHFKISDDWQAKFQQRFSKLGNRRLRANFLKRLLTGNLPDLEITDKGVRIKFASVGEALDLKGAKIPYTITLSNCNFEEEVEFESAQFLAMADFSAAQFFADVEFRGTQFSAGAYFGLVQFFKKANFSESYFSGKADFGWTQFSAKAYFRKVQFYGRADFGGTLFSAGAYFSETQFLSRAYFYESQFSGKADFGWTQFSAEAYFREALFFGNANFFKAQFSGKAYFFKAQFSGEAYFGKAQFSGNVDIEGAQFYGEAYFGKALFSEKASFGEATFSGSTYFSQVTFIKEANFSSCNFAPKSMFNKSLFHDTVLFNDVSGFSKMFIEFTYSPDKFGYENENTTITLRELKNHLKYNETFFIALLKNFRDMGWYKEADDCYYTYRIEKRKNRLKELNKKSEKEKKLTAIIQMWQRAKLYGEWLLLDLTFGYGVKPKKIFWTFILFWAFFIPIYSILLRHQWIKKQKWFKDPHRRFFRATVFSLDTLTPGVNFRSEATLPPYTFSHSDFRKPIFNFCIRFQQILGWYWAALFLILFSKIWIR